MKKQKKKNNHKVIFIAVSVISLLFSVFLVSQGQQRQELRSQAQTLSNCTVSATDFALDAEEQAFITLLNQYRQQSGLSTVKVSPTLNRSAAWMARDQATQDKLSHVDSLGRGFSERNADCGFSAGGTGGENAAITNGTATQTMDVWQNSSAHNVILLKADTKAIGIGRAQTAGGQWYWTYVGSSGDDSSSGTVPTLAASPTTAPTTPPTVAPTSAQPTTAPSPSAPVPSAACLGSCPTTVPTPTGASTSPSITEPILSEAPVPSESQLSPNPSDTQPTGGLTLPSISPIQGGGDQAGGQGTNQGIIALLIAFILQLLAALFGGFR